MAGNVTEITATISCAQKHPYSPWSANAGCTADSMLMNALLKELCTREAAAQDRRTFCLKSTESPGLKDTDLCDDDEPLSSRTDFRAIRSFLSLPTIGSSHRLLVIQPKLTTPELRRLATTNEDLELEALQLVKSVPGWTISTLRVSSVKVSPGARFLFGSGKLEELKALVGNSRDCTGIFLNVDRLSPLQSRTLLSVFRVPVFDRFTVALQIFKFYACSKEAKIQAALAELEYMKVHVTSYAGGFMQKHLPRNLMLTGIDWKKRDAIISRRQLKMKEKLKEVVAQRNILRQNAQRRHFPLVAVVGYTNCGKTSLIRCLSENGDLSGEDRFFATLDVTMHAGKLPCKLPILYADTVGFFSNLPKDLMSCFNATLEEITYADLIVHVVDRSNPNWQFQRDSVNRTFDQLSTASNLTLSPIEVWNKSDKFQLETEDEKPKEATIISCSTGEGLSKLLTLIEDRILKTTTYRRFVVRIPITGAYLSSLYSIGSIVATDTQPNSDHMSVTLVTRRHHIDKLLRMHPNVIQVLSGPTTAY